MAGQKLTKKYYRDAINASYSSACSVFKEALKKYGAKSSTRGHREAKLQCEFNWNHEITGFYYAPKNHFYVDVYWQGDHTDGDDCHELTYSGFVIPAEMEEDYRYGGTRERHGNIRVDKDELYKAMKVFASTYLN